jgi:hypothetical protein
MKVNVADRASASARPTPAHNTHKHGRITMLESLRPAINSKGHAPTPVRVECMARMPANVKLILQE